jgi:hypothetical protein
LTICPSENILSGKIKTKGSNVQLILRVRLKMKAPLKLLLEPDYLFLSLNI